MELSAKVKQLVQQVVESHIKEQIQKAKKPKLSILLGYQPQKPTEVLKAVSTLMEEYDITFLVTKEWLPLLTINSIESYVRLDETNHQDLSMVIKETSLLAIPVASIHLVAKLALTIDDDLVTWIAIQYQLAGKPIVITSNHIEPTVYQQISAPHSVLERLQSYIRQISSEQVKLVSLNHFFESVSEQYQSYHEKQSLILAKHIEKAHKEGLNQMIVPMNTRLTPIANDLAKELHIQIVRNNSSKGGNL